jgi:hypothetical protein
LPLVLATIPVEGFGRFHLPEIPFSPGLRRLRRRSPWEKKSCWRDNQGFEYPLGVPSNLPPGEAPIQFYDL